MISILHLPDELLVHLAKFILPEDLTNYAQICRRVYNVTSARLQEHKELLRLYQHVSLDSYQATAYYHPIHLVSDILNNPFVGHYIQTIFFQPEDPFMGSDGIHPRSSFRPDIAQMIHLCIGRFSSIPGLHSVPPSDRQHWLESIRRGQHGPAFALLLTLLPNLRKLTLDCIREYEVYTKYALHVRASKHSLEPPASKAYNTLHTVRILSKDGASPLQDIQGLAPFALVPSVRSLAGHRVKLFDPVYAWPTTPTTSSVEAVDFGQGGQSNDLGFASFISRLPHLRSLEFRFSCRDGDPHNLEVWDSSHLFKALSASGAALSLQRLCLRYQSPKSAPRLSHHLRSLPNLRSLELDVDFLYDRQAYRSELSTYGLALHGQRQQLQRWERPYCPAAGGAGGGSAAYLVGPSADGAPQPPSGAQADRLVDILPAKLRAVDFFSVYVGLPMIYPLFDGFADLRAQRLPELETLSLRMSMFAPADVKFSEAEWRDVQAFFRGLDEATGVAMTAYRVQVVSGFQSGGIYWGQA